MKQIVIISGKGGTGKTVITASFAALARNKVLADCDVDAADLHLLLHPTIKERHEFRSGFTAVLDKEKCTECKHCIEVCRFNAISEADSGVVIDPISCEGCCLCSRVCPAGAITMEENLSGEWFMSDTQYGPLVHARLGIAEENSGKLVMMIREKSKELAEDNNNEFCLIDGPPGIGCPVIASMTGVDLALIVTEPTLSGIHDLQRVSAVADHFGIKRLVCINKYDLNLENTQRIKEYCRKANIEVAGEIPFDKTVTEALVHGKPVVEFENNQISACLESLWSKVVKACGVF